VQLAALVEEDVLLALEIKVFASLVIVTVGGVVSFTKKTQNHIKDKLSGLSFFDNYQFVLIWYYILIKFELLTFLNISHNEEYLKFNRSSKTIQTTAAKY
jgi:hypothetical protein